MSRTIAQLAEQLNDPTILSTAVIGLRDEIAARRSRLNARLADIEPERRASFDPAQHVRLNRESEVAETELSLLYELDNRTFKAHEQALDREAPDVAKEARKKLDKVVKLAEAAKVEHEQRVRELREVCNTLCGALSRMQPAGTVPTYRAVDDEMFSRIATVLFDVPSATPDQLAGGRRRLRIDLCGPEPIRYADPEPDHAELARFPSFSRRDS